MFSEILLGTEEVETPCGRQNTTYKLSKNNAPSLKRANAAQRYIQGSVSLMGNIFTPCTKNKNKNQEWRTVQHMKTHVEEIYMLCYGHGCVFAYMLDMNILVILLLFL